MIINMWRRAITDVDKIYLFKGIIGSIVSTHNLNQSF